jgi:hypothetical protein
VASYLVPVSVKSNMGDSSFDVRHRIVGNISYEIPAVKLSNRVLNTALESWRVSSIVEAQSGIPYLIFAGYDANRGGDTNAYATLVSGPHSTSITKSFTSSGSSASLFTCSGFSSSTHTNTCTSGSNTYVFSQDMGVQDPKQRIHRGTFRNPGLFNLDLRLTRGFQIWQKVHADFSADAFNLLNHVNFSAVSSTMSTSSFGRSLSQATIGHTGSRQVQFGLRLQY